MVGTNAPELQMPPNSKIAVKLKLTCQTSGETMWCRCHRRCALPCLHTRGLALLQALGGQVRKGRRTIRFPRRGVIHGNGRLGENISPAGKKRAGCMAWVQATRGVYDSSETRVYSLSKSRLRGYCFSLHLRVSLAVFKPCDCRTANVCSQPSSMGTSRTAARVLVMHSRASQIPP